MPQVGGQSLDHLDRATFAHRRGIGSVMTVQVGALLGPGEIGSLVTFGELDGGQGY
jgi:hypothetical protein